MTDPRLIAPGMDPVILSPAFEAMRRVPRWIPYRLTPKKRESDKVDKVPLCHRTGIPVDAHDPENHADVFTAAISAQRFGPSCGIGFVFTKADGFVFLDIDRALSDDGQWSSTAYELRALLPAAAWELSVSGRGLHAFFKGQLPAHQCAPPDTGLELYDSGRFCAMTGTQAQGDAGTVASVSTVGELVSRYFAPRQSVRKASAAASEWLAMTEGQQLRTVEVLRSALDAIPSDDYHLWIKVGQCLRALGELGRDIWEQWSSKSSKFDDSGLSKWDTFKGDRAGYTGVFTEAQSRGWVHPGRDAATVGFGQAPPPADASSATYWADRPIFGKYPLDLAKALLSRHFEHPEAPRLRCWQGTFYKWEGAAWNELTPADVRARVYEFLDKEAFDFKPSNSRASDFTDALRAAAHLDSSVLPPAWIAGSNRPDPGELTACGNGLLHLPSRALHLPSPAFFSLNAIPSPYIAAAPQPVRWLEFLRNAWPDDPEAITTLQELFGYLLTPDTSQQKLFMIIGPKRSGKGTIARVLTELLGKGNVASPTLSSLGGEFGLQPLVGKLAAVVPDARLGGRSDPRLIVENLLRISGEDAVDVNRKGIPAMTLRLGVRFLLLTNELPRLADASGAMSSRFIVLTMTESFLGREDPGLTSKLLTELPGVLAWAVEGWTRLRARGHFLEPASSREASQDLADLGSPISTFVRECCELDPTAEAATQAIYQAWRTWCGMHGVDRPGDSASFARNLRAAFPKQISPHKPRDGGQRVPSYRGIRIRAGQGWSGTTLTP